MNTVRTVAELRERLAPRARARAARVGLVPTMGSFHEGHLSLMRRAREDCDVVVVSLFVNPAQFGAGEDLEAYPRDEAARRRACREPRAWTSCSRRRRGGLSARLRRRRSGWAGSPTSCAAARRAAGAEHFDGVTTVVTKLSTWSAPDVAYFGQKDAQQALVIQKLVRDLDIPVRVEVCPTVREPDGLAMSSRNAYLSEAERERAAALSRALARRRATR